VERIAAARIARVVVAVRDPNPRVAGRGFDYLRERGISVDLGTGAEQAARQNEAFFTWIRERRPFVISKTAISADGFVGRSAGPVKLTDPVADRWFHRQRAEVDALAVGAGTVLTDDPRLTPREVYRVRPLTRVLFDWRLRIPAAARVFSTLQAGPVIMITTGHAAEQRAEHVAALLAQGMDVERFAARDPAAALTRMGERGVLSLLLEGGPTLQTAFAEAGLIDRVQCVTTPHVLGAGVPAPPVALESIGKGRILRLGADTLHEVDLSRS
jgi:diaminohydroxyphosphoribosylaminopyrimidine deaminase/5-amino-6-(5-phosphoribosylamino)uracil reductase